MRTLLCLSFVFVLGPSFAQGDAKLSADVSAGLIAPTGKALSASYSIGIALGIEGTYRPGNYFIALEMSGDLFVNNPPSASSISDNLVLFGPSLKAGYTLSRDKLSIEPFISIGYEWGVNSIAPRSSGSSGQSIDLMNLKGVSVGPGFMVKMSDRLSVGVCYKFYAPNVTLTQAATAAFSTNPTQLYGPLTSVPDQNLVMDRLSFRLHWKL